MQTDVELVLVVSGWVAVSEATHVAAGHRMPVDHDDPLADRCEVGPAGQAAGAGSDDDDIRVGAHASSQSQVVRRLTAEG